MADVGERNIIEIRACVEARAQERARIIPAILPDVDKLAELPPWVRQTDWVHMWDWERSGSDAFYRLVCGIPGKPPGDAPLMRFGVRDVAGWRGWRRERGQA